MSRRREKRIREEVGGNRAEARRVRRGRQLSSQAGQGHGNVTYEAPNKVLKEQAREQAKSFRKGIRGIAERAGIILPESIDD